jgi:DNA-binding NarL/FixJ family response regulator
MSEQVIADDTMRFVAEALLEMCEQERSAPFYTDRLYARLTRRRSEREVPYGALLRRFGHDSLLASECEEVYHMAKLTPRQSEVLSMRLEGYSFEEIGRHRRHTKQGAQRIFVQALKKIAHSFRVYPYAGLSDVYERETHRGCRRGGFGTMRR